MLYPFLLPRAELVRKRSAWSPCYYNSDNYPELTKSQKSLLVPPSAFGPAHEVNNIWKKAQEEQQELINLRKNQN